MTDRIQNNSQSEYSRILDLNNARKKRLSHTECERILMNAGASYEQAKNGSYVYLRHGNHQVAIIRATQDEYDVILDKFNAREKKPQDCIKHLENKGFSYGQSKTAVYKYRRKRNLIGH